LFERSARRAGQSLSPTPFRRKLRERDRLLMEARIAANNDPETLKIEREVAALPDTVTEDWDEPELSPAR